MARISLSALENKLRKKRQRKLSVKPCFQRKSQSESQEGYKNYLAMTEDNFEGLLTIVKGDIEKQHTRIGDAIRDAMRDNFSLYLPDLIFIQ